METLKSAIFCVCSAALGFTLAECILPIEKFEKEIRLLLSVLLMTVLLRPLTALHFSYQSEITESTEIATDIAEQANALRASEAAVRIRNAVNQKLTEEAVPCCVREIRLHICSESGICIDEVIIEGNAVTGAVFLRELLGKDITITKGDDLRAENP